MSQAPHDPTRPAPAAWQPQAPGNASRALPILGVVLGLLGLALGLLGLAVGVAAWLRAAPSRDAAEPVYSEQQVADAKRAICDAYERAVRSMRVVASRVIENPGEALPVAVNSRLAEVAVGNYLINASAANPAAPPELQKLVRDLAQAYQDVALIQLADGVPEDYQPEREIVDRSVSKLDMLCL